MVHITFTLEGDSESRKGSSIVYVIYRLVSPFKCQHCSRVMPKRVSERYTRCFVSVFRCLTLYSSHILTAAGRTKAITLKASKAGWHLIVCFRYIRTVTTRLSSHTFRVSRERAKKMFNTTFPTSNAVPNNTARNERNRSNLTEGNASSLSVLRSSGIHERKRNKMAPSQFRKILSHSIALTSVYLDSRKKIFALRNLAFSRRLDMTTNVKLIGNLSALPLTASPLRRKMRL